MKVQHDLVHSFLILGADNVDVGVIGAIDNQSVWFVSHLDMLRMNYEIILKLLRSVCTIYQKITSTIRLATLYYYFLFLYISIATVKLASTMEYFITRPNTD